MCNSWFVHHAETVPPQTFRQAHFHPSPKEPARAQPSKQASNQRSRPCPSPLVLLLLGRSHASEPYIPIKPYRCPRKCAPALYSLYSHIQALFIPLKPSFFSKRLQSNNSCIIFIKILKIFFSIFFHWSLNSQIYFSDLCLSSTLIRMSAWRCAQ